MNLVKKLEYKRKSKVFRTNIDLWLIDFAYMFV